jgi:acyl-coenzyme A thioesterase PaaI-like protein
MLDEIMGRSVIYIMKKVGLTKSMEIDFIKPAFIGRELRIEGRVKEVNGDREVLVEGVLYNGEGEVCARSKGTFAIFPPDKIRQWGIGSEEVLDWLERFLQRS